jgi:hypothetical protein
MKATVKVSHLIAESGRRGIVSKVGMARRAVPNLRREAPFPEQVRLQPMRFATLAWQAAVKNGTPAARHPYPFLSKGAAAPLAPSASIGLFSFPLTPSIPTFLEVMS